MENNAVKPVELNSDNPKDVITFAYEHLSRIKEDGVFHKFVQSGMSTLIKLIEENEKLKIENESIKK